MPGVDPNFIKQELNVLPNTRPIKQQGRRSATEYVDAVIKEVEKLKEASATTEGLYPSWLSNTIVVKKKTDQSIGGLYFGSCLDELPRCILRGEKISEAGSSKIQSIPGDPKVIQESPQATEMTVDGDNLGVLEVISEPPQIDPATAWKRFVDGVRNNLGVGVGIVLKSPEVVIFEHCIKLSFPATNNEAKYEAFIVGLWSANKLKVPELYIFSDSKLVVNQVTGKFETRVTKMAKYLALARSLLTEFRAVKIEQVGRDLNSHADALESLASIFEGEID
ncbi:hypothetical protein Acr_11g0011730 [Actinidia rufa]|uniref:RNase H type-1 domain-containing protein n=1 Tax=Actinidia rufa TaxID=165716 RepID=A0A7J0FG37_9ERIC|nr:hypothetical protein Acr_11g0011730 [Actinidia rufa]